MLPVYYTSQGMTAIEVKQAKQAWDMINDDLSPIYLDKLCSTSFAQAYPNCKDWYFLIMFKLTFNLYLTLFLNLQGFLIYFMAEFLIFIR